MRIRWPVRARLARRLRGPDRARGVAARLVVPARERSSVAGDRGRSSGARRASWSSCGARVGHLGVAAGNGSLDTGRAVRCRAYRRSPMLDATWTIRPCDREQAAALAAALGVSETTASGARPARVQRPRGRAAASSPARCPGTIRSCSATCARPANGSAPRSPTGRGSASTATTTSTGSARPRSPCSSLRELGADVEWHLPSRFEEGYGVAGETLARLAAEGCGLVLTVDCGITAVAEVARGARGRARGDRHRPPPPRRRAARLPDRRHAAVRLSVPGALRHRRRLQARARRCSARRRALARHLDLVALATIADVVPLVDENRALAIAGLRRLATTTRPGLRALMQAARVDPAVVDEGAVGFRLAPRINAAGRLGRPDRRARAAADRRRGRRDADRRSSSRS